MALGSTRSEEMRVRLWLPFSIATSMVSSHESVQYMFLPNQSTAIPVEGRKVKRPFHDKERTDWQIIRFDEIDANPSIRLLVGRGSFDSSHCLCSSDCLILACHLNLQIHSSLITERSEWFSIE